MDGDNNTDAQLSVRTEMFVEDDNSKLLQSCLRTEIGTLKTRNVDEQGSNSGEFVKRRRFEVDPQLVLITTDKLEIEKRIRALIERKRAEIDILNRREFCGVFFEDQESSCARVNALYTPQPGSRSHIKVTRACNSQGPQTCPLLSPSKSSVERRREAPSMNNLATSLPSHLEERISNMEIHLQLKPDETLTIYSRIKNLEDRILHLESVSPEYFTSPFLRQEQPANHRYPDHSQMRHYSNNDRSRYSSNIDGAKSSHFYDALDKRRRPRELHDNSRIQPPTSDIVRKNDDVDGLQ